MAKVEWPEFAACLAEMMKGDEEETAYRECFRWILLLFVVVVVFCGYCCLQGMFQVDLVICTFFILLILKSQLENVKCFTHINLQ